MVIAKHEQDAQSDDEDTGTENGGLGVLRQHTDEQEHENAAPVVATAVVAREALGHANQNAPTYVAMRDVLERLEDIDLGEASQQEISPQLVVKLVVIWDVKIAAMSREKLEKLLKHIFEILATYDVRQQCVFKHTIVSALSGEMVRPIKLKFNDEANHFGRFRMLILSTTTAVPVVD